MLLNEEYLRKVVRESIHSVLMENEQPDVNENLLSYHIDNIINGELDAYKDVIDLSELDGEEDMDISIIGKDGSYYDMKIKCYHYIKYGESHGDGYITPSVEYFVEDEEAGIDKIDDIKHFDENGENECDIKIDDKESLGKLYIFLEDKINY